jgi:hypothetical protein
MDHLYDAARLWLINDIVHSWIDPIDETFVIIAGIYVIYRVVCFFATEKD